MSLKPCSYGAAQGPEGTRLSHATVIPSVAVTGNKQGQNTDTKHQASEGSPSAAPPSSPHPGVFALGSLSLCWERDRSRVLLRPCKWAGSVLVPSGKSPALSNLRSAFTAPSSTEAALTRGCSQEVRPQPPLTLPLVPATDTSRLLQPSHASDCCA